LYQSSAIAFGTGPELPDEEDELPLEAPLEPPLDDVDAPLLVAPELELADSPLLPPPAPLHAAMTT
jgi:hypothetical protein